MAKTSRKDQLKKMSMPKDSAPEKEAGDDLDSLLAHEDKETPEDEAAESPEEQKMEGMLGVEKHGDKSGAAPDLEDISDEDLIAEMHKRGLIEGGDEDKMHSADDDSDMARPGTAPAKDQSYA